MMGEFIASSYWITREGRHVADGVFNAAEEIFERIRCQRAGVYRVHRQLASGEDSDPETALWGEVAHFGAGRICFDPSPGRSLMDRFHENTE
jgi:hypothetical protein